MNSNRLLVVDDDREIRDLLSQFLRKHGFTVDTAKDAVSMDARLLGAHYDLIILDIMMPGEDGLSVCRRMRANSNIPIIMLTAAGDDTDRIVGLEIGADDYLPKPFNPRELLARIKAVLRRMHGEDNLPAESAELLFDGWCLDDHTRKLTTPAGSELSLTTGEYELLKVFVINAQRVLNRDQLLNLTKGRNASAFDRSIDVQLSRLRKKLEQDPKHPQLIKTVRGGGYMFTAKVDKK